MGSNDVVFVIGVSGTGKSTIAAALAETKGAAFLDADDFHPPENVEAMRNGVALTDEMRLGWLETVGQTASNHKGDVCFACSALKKTYRDILRKNAPGSQFVLLDVARETLQTRMKQRKNHYMPPSLLDSQLATFEFPTASETDVIVVDGELPVGEIVKTIRSLN